MRTILGSPSRGRFPLSGGNVPKGQKGSGCWLGAAETERLLQICIEKPKPQIQFAVWKGRNGLRGKEAPRIAGTRSVEAGSDAPPAAISFPSRGKRYGKKGRLRMRLVLPASAFRQDPMFRASFHSRLTLRVSAARRLIRGCRICSWLP